MRMQSYHITHEMIKHWLLIVYKRYFNFFPSLSGNDKRFHGRDYRLFHESEKKKTVENV